MTDTTQQNSLLGKIAAYTEILAKDPSSTIFVSLSEAYRKMGMLDDARQVVSNGLEHNPDFAPAHIVLGRILCQQGDYQNSEMSFLRALELDPTNLAALVGYARLNILLGREEKARESLLEARRLSPADPVINKLLLSLPEAPAPSQETETEPEPDDQPPEPGREKTSPLASATLAQLYLKQGMEKEALEMYRQLSAQSPDNLALRRKIRDLESTLDTDSEALNPDADKDVPGSPSPVEQSVAEEESFEPSQEAPGEANDDTSPPEPELAADHDQVTTGSVETAASVQGSGNETAGGKEQVLGTLKRWLDNIQQRRADVQTNS